MQRRHYSNISAIREHVSGQEAWGGVLVLGVGWDGFTAEDTFSFTRHAVFTACDQMPQTTFCTKRLQSRPRRPKGPSKAKSLRARGGHVWVWGVRREGMGKEIGFVETKLFGKPPSSYRWPASRMRQATAVMSAAPLPLPSSDCRKVTSHLGDSCFTVSCMTVEKCGCSL